MRSIEKTRSLEETSARSRHDELLGQVKRALDDSVMDKAQIKTLDRELREKLAETERLEVVGETLKKELNEAKKKTENAVIEEKRLVRQLKKIVYNYDAAK